MQNKIMYWEELSDYDLDTAIAMLSSKRYLYVGFLCHQTIEKIFKAYYIKQTGDIAPYSHSLSFLAKQSSFYEHLSEEQKNLLTFLNPLILKHGIHHTRNDY